MNIDLSVEELSLIVKMIEAGTLSDPVTNSIYRKATRCLQNVKPPGYDDDPKAAAEKWKSPI